jgi:hypothetical protein
VIRLVASVTTWLALTAVLLVSGGHTVYYLLEWEWVRAQIAGIAFIAALVVSATVVVLVRLRALERRIDVLVQSVGTAAPAGPPETVRAAVSATATDPEPRPDFAWLSASGGWSALALPLLAVPVLRDPAPAVFIPVFLATGVAVSVVASGVEWVAAHRRVRNPAAPAAAAPGPTVVAEPRRRISPWAAVTVPLGGAVVIGAVIGGLWLTAHYWSEPIGPGTTTLVLEVERNGRISSDLEVAEVLGRYCVLNAGVNVHYGDVGPGADGRVLLRVTPLLDEDAQKRFGGCLEDAVLDRHRVGVTDVRLAPR